ncbi:MAG: AAA-like domain-containing protein [Capsulimonadales bacterium]|nr:AAA-like domain-containing protein [Capsulimonadales bacterium]
MTKPMRIAHILFVDIVGYSTVSLEEQSRIFGLLTETVDQLPVFVEARVAESVLPVPSGDGMALVFQDDVTAPVRCAIELTRRIAGAIPLRIGLHSGLVHILNDISGKRNVVGEGINTAKRVMDQGDAGHILLSEQHANWLRQSDHWRNLLFPLGQRIAKHGLELTLFTLVTEEAGMRIGSRTIPAHWGGVHPSINASDLVSESDSPTVVLLCRRGGKRDEEILRFIERSLEEQGFHVFRDRNRCFRPGWAEEMRERIRTAKAVIAVVSPESRRSEMLPWELEQAREFFDDTGRPAILPLLVGLTEELPDADDEVTRWLHDLPTLVRNSSEDDYRIVAEIVSAIRGPLRPVEATRLEPVGGAVPLNSAFYISRPCDTLLTAAVDARESIILIPGPRQVGKTSLLARAAQQARAAGARVLQTDFQQVNASYLADEKRFYRGLAATMAKQQGFRYDFEQEWDDFLAPNENLNYFLESLVNSADTPLVWCLDEADKVFPATFASDFYGLIRSFHNSRANRPDGPWDRLTLIIAYATEARLFIRDLNQSPFNVGRKLELVDFDPEQFHLLNHRYGNPLSSFEEEQVYGLLSGQPFLSRRALDSVATGTFTCAALLQDAIRDDGPFHDHLQRLMLGITELPTVRAFVRQVLNGTATVTDTVSFDRLMSAGVIVRKRDGAIRFRCELYHRYLADHLG